MKAALEDRFPQGNEVEERSSFRRPLSDVGGGGGIAGLFNTIEPWRLLQTWASRQLDAQGMWRLERQFDESALGALYDFSDYMIWPCCGGPEIMLSTES